MLVVVIILNNAQTRGKPIRYLETIDQQIALLAPSDPKVDLEGFEAFLKEFKNEGGELVYEDNFKKISLSDYKGKYVVLFFYPLDFTFVCPTEIK